MSRNQPSYVSATSSSGADVLVSGARLLFGIPLRIIDVCAQATTLASCIQIQTAEFAEGDLVLASQPTYICRSTLLESFPWKIRAATITEANCVWHIANTEPPTLELLCMENFSKITELRMERSWFDDNPRTLAPSERHDLLWRWRAQTRSLFFSGRQPHERHTTKSHSCIG